MGEDKERLLVVARITVSDTPEGLAYRWPLLLCCVVARYAGASTDMAAFVTRLWLPRLDDVRTACAAAA